MATHLEAAVASLCYVLDPEVGFRDPGIAEFGLVNACS